MAVLSRNEFYQQYEAAKQQGMTGGQAVNYLAQAAVAAQPKVDVQPTKVDTWQPSNNLVKRSDFNTRYGTNTAQTQQPTYDANKALKQLQQTAATTTDKQLAKTIKKYTSGDAKKDNFWGQTSASFGSGKINELLNQAWGKYAEDGTAESKAIADAYAQLAEYYQNVNAEALDDKNRKAKWLSQDMAQYAPQFLEQTKASAAPIIGGAAAGAVIGELVTPIPGLDALVGGLAGGIKGAMGGTVAGTKVGGLIGAGKYSYNTMRGAAMKNLLEAGATTEQAQEASRDEAIISTAIENLDNAADLFLLIPGMGGMGKAAAKTALGKFAEWAGNVAQEGGEEFIQEIISIANERRVKNGTTGDGAIGLAKEVMSLGQEIMKNAKNSEELKQALEAARGGAVIGGFMGPVGAAINKTVTAPMQNAALNKINDIAPNQEVAQQNRNVIAESALNQHLDNDVNKTIQNLTVSPELRQMSEQMFDNHRMELSQIQNGMSVFSSGKKIGEVKGRNDNGARIIMNDGSITTVVFTGNGMVDPKSSLAIYLRPENDIEFSFATPEETAQPTVAENPQEMATQAEVAPETPSGASFEQASEMASETPVNDAVDEGISMPPMTPSEATAQSDELVGQANEDEDADENYDEDVAFLDRQGKPIYWDIRDQNHDQLIGERNWGDRYGLNQAIKDGYIRIKPNNGIELSFENGRLTAAQREGIEKIINSFKGRTFYVDGDIEAGDMMQAYYGHAFEGEDIDAKTIINWINRTIAEHEQMAAEYAAKADKTRMQRMLTLDEYGKETNDYELGGEVFSPEDVARMTEDDVKYRLNSWAKRLGLKNMRGLSETLSTILNANQTEDYAGSSIEKNTSKYAALQRGETVLPEIELIEELSDEELDELFALLDRAEDLGLAEEINGEPEITTPNKETAERDFHGETAYGEQIKAIDEDIAVLEEELDRLYKLERINFTEDSPAIKDIKDRIESLRAEKERYEAENEKAEQENDKTVRNKDAELEEQRTAAEQEKAEEAAREKAAKGTFYGGSVASNGKSFVKASEMPDAHKSGSGGRVRGVKVNGETYYAVASEEKGGYKNIIPDADVKAANNLIKQIKDYIKTHTDAIQYYKALRTQGKALPPKLPGIFRRVTALQTVLDKIQNQGYTLQDLWNDRTIPQDIIAASPKNDDLRNRSIASIANGVPESDAIRRINEMIGEQNERESKIRTSEISGQLTGRAGHRQNESNGVSQRRVGNLDNNGQSQKAESKRTSGRLPPREENRELTKKRKQAGAAIAIDLDRSVKSEGSVAGGVLSMQKQGFDGKLFNKGNFGVVVKGVKTIADSTGKELSRVVEKAKNFDVQAFLCDAVSSIETGEGAAKIGGTTIFVDGKAILYGNSVEALLHESSHHDFEKATDFMLDNGITADAQKWLDRKLGTIFKEVGIDYAALKKAASKGGYTADVAEEIYCEMAALVSTNDSVSYYDSDASTMFTDAGDALRSSEAFAKLIQEVQSYADEQLNIDFAENSEFEGKPVGKSVAFLKDPEAGIEDVMRMIEEDRKKPSLAEYKASRETMDAESREEIGRDIGEEFEKYRESSPKPRESTMEERFDVKGDPQPLKLAKKVADQAVKLKSKSVLNNDAKRAKMFGENKAAQRAKARYNGYMDMLSDVANAKKDVADLFTFANVLKGDAEMGVYVNDKVLKALRVAAQLEEESAQNPTPDVVNAYKYQATKAMAMAAQQVENVDRVQSTIQSGLIEAALKYSKGNTNNVLVKGAQWLNRMQLNPGNFFRMIGGYDKESRNTGYALQQRIDRQNTVRITTEAKAKSFFSGLKNDKQYRDFASGKATSNVKMGDHNLSMLQAVQFKMLCDTLGIDNIKTSRLETLNGFALRDAGGNDTFIEMQGKTQAERFAWASQMYDQAVKDIENNSAAKAYMDAAVKMFEDIKGDLVSVGEKVDGFPKAMYAEGKYLPLSYASKDGHPMDWALVNDMQNGLSSTRIMQERVRDNGGYAVIKPVSQTVDAYISQASNYIAYAELGNDLAIMGDANSLFGSIQDTIAKNFGDTYAQWYNNYSNDINQIKESDPTGLNKFLASARSKMMQGALLGSLSVPIKQVSSYFSAMGVLDPRAVMRAYKGPLRAGKKAIGNIRNLLLLSREQGSIDPDVSQALQTGWVNRMRNSSKVGAFIANATNIMDSRTVANVYLASVYDVEMNSGLTKAELYQNKKDITGGLTPAGEYLVDAKFGEAVLNTQPIFTKQARAEIARTSSEALRMLSTFRTQQTQNYNRLLTTINEAAAAKKFGRDTKAANTELKQTIEGQVAAAVSISALTIAADMLLHKHKKYKDDDDEFDEGKILERLALNTIEAGAGTTLFGGELSKWLIDQIKGNTGDYASNKEFYGISMGAISSVQSAFNAANWLYSDMLKGGKHVASNARYVVNYVSTLLGIPTQNAYNLVNAIYQHFGDAIGEDFLSGYTNGKYEDIMKEWDGIRTDYGNKLYSAIKAGDEAKAKQSVEQMGDKFLSMIKSSSIDQLKSGDADDAEVMNVLMTYGNRTAEEAAQDVQNMHLQIDTGYTYLTGTGKQTAETAYKDGNLSRDEFKKLYTKYSDKTADQAEYSINRIDFKQKYPGNTYQDIKKMYMDGKLSKSEAAEWRYKTQENTTKESAENWVKNLDFQKMTGYEANYTSSSDLYDTYESKEKLGVISFYDKYGSQFSSPKAFGDVFNYLNNNERTDFPTYKTSYGETSKNQSRVITLMNELIQQKKITYGMAKKIWSEHYGWSTSGKSAWVNVKAA